MSEETNDIDPRERASSTTSSEELEKLAEEKQFFIREEVAKNENTPVHVLEKR